MQVKQIYTLVNDVTREVLGKEALMLEDLSNVVDVGTEIINANAVDNYVRTLVDRIGRVVFVNRPYSGGAPSVLMDGWEYGSVLEKIAADIPEATENESWELEDGVSYDPNIFYKPKVYAKFFNSKVTFEVPVSITERQVKESFTSPTQLNAFLSMIYNAVDKSMTIKLDGLVERTINSMIGETFHAEFADGTYTGKTSVKAVNLLYEYNTAFTKTLTVAQAMKDPEFIRYASYAMGLYIDRMKKISTLFNIGGRDRFTPRDMLHLVALNDFDKAASTYLYGDTYHNQFVSLPKYETVPYWQASGVDYSFDSISQINIKTGSGDTINAKGILAVMFDRDALGVTNLNRRVTTNYNPKAEFFSNWYKFDAGYFNDLNENFVVFYVA
nr:MAG TPA: major capsid protein [Caudoviricetes sp.]